MSILTFAGCSTLKSDGPAQAVKPVIVIAAFGSSMESGQKNLEDVDRIIRESFPDYEVRWAFTAQFIIDKLRNAGQTTVFERKVPVISVEELYAQLIKEGKTRAVVQSLHNMVGSEFRQVLNTPTKGLDVKFSYPLLFNPENIQNAANALTNEFGDPSDTATILCAHGNEHHPVYNAQLIELDNYLRNNFEHAYLACVEGPPEFDKVKDDVLSSGVSKVKFIPFLFTYGDHMSNDVMGDEPDSWKVQLGLPATSADGMGSNPAIIEIFVRSLRGVLKQFS